MLSFWESHEEDKTEWAVDCELNCPQAVYQVANSSRNYKLNDTSAGSDSVKDLLRHLLSSPATTARKTTPFPSDHEILVQPLLGTVQPTQPVLPERPSATDMEGADCPLAGNIA